MRDPGDALQVLFDAERSVRAAHDALLDADPEASLSVLEKATRSALTPDELDEDEVSLRLVRLAAVLGEMHGPLVVDLLIDILASDDPEARHAAGEALSGLAFDRFKEVALGVERALGRLPIGSPALAELPYMLAEVPEPGAEKLLVRFLAHADADAVAATIEALVDTANASTLALLEPLASDTRKVQLEDDGGTDGEATIAELVAEARAILSKGDA